ncbi:xylulokinase [Succinatimonas hippei]|uniref:Carbohydrate kinase, FGGY family protein n=1 Tax=Succinatimonas hippei (strain DSM 22608 / JCM 16073 / KCTC 15190 / YIT 12066) TaxID=762983 RepID=E8LHZ0_SUCHY|nr:FGGY family carbohydrate kinase [Succinatimonas hippei]EFY07886.1 carbohydrate kinase, FGGY family protein [Succinatimonas hippei YIT 12066]MCL1602778.1 FGGY family carbohydrate kinase [Succinatimonas hippei]
MKAIYLLGVDVGTSSIKTVILDSNAKVVAEETDFYRLINPDQVSIQVDAADMWRAFINCVSHLVSRNNVDPTLIGAISISSLCPGLAAFDAAGKLLVDPIIYSDRRSTQEAEIFREKVGDKRLFEITANSAMAGAMSGTSILWIKRNLPEIYERTKYFGHINTLMAQKLCGNFAIDHSNASYTLLYETVDRGIWSEELCEKVGIDIEKLPPLHKSTDVVGTLINQELLDLGLLPDTKIVIGGGDTACATFAAGVVKQWDVCESVGTSDVLTVAVEKPLFSPKFINRRHVVDGAWIYQGAMSHTGSSYKWMYDNFYQDFQAIASGSGKKGMLMMNEDAAKAAPGADGLVFLPYMMGERSPVWDAYARGEFFGLSLKTTRREMNRAVLEGCAYGLRQMFDICEELTGEKITHFSSIGGGAKSKVWAQIKADITGRDITVLDMSDMAPVGAALLAGVGAGVFKDVYEASAKVEKAVYTKIKHSDADKEVYDRRYQVYTGLYPRLKDLYRVNLGIKEN